MRQLSLDIPHWTTLAPTEKQLGFIDGLSRRGKIAEPVPDDLSRGDAARIIAQAVRSEAPPIVPVSPGPDCLQSRLEALRSPRGGFTRRSLAILGVPWPLVRGWRKRLLRSCLCDACAVAREVTRSARRARNPFDAEIAMLAREHADASGRMATPWLDEHGRPDTLEDDPCRP